MASAVGTTIEWYDFFIYGTAAATVFGPQFFPQVSELAGTLASFATFGIGFIARPLGGVVMGHYGDRLGRKFMLVWSLLLMGVATLAIGLLPTYAQIGAWAPVLLVVLRFVQGFALGGEWGGAILMSVEHAPEGAAGSSADRRAGPARGHHPFEPGVPRSPRHRWRPPSSRPGPWRLPFIASAALVAVGLWVRLGIAESPVFAAAVATHGARRMPIARRAAVERRAPCCWRPGSYLAISSLGYVVLVYFVTYATRQLGLSLPLTLAMVLTASAVCAPSIVLSAQWSDRARAPAHDALGPRRARVVVARVLPAARHEVRAARLAGGVGMLFIQGVYIGPQPAVFAELFPTAVRYSGASLSLTLGTIVGGAIAPIVATYLFSLTGTSTLITVYMTAVSAGVVRLLARPARNLPRQPVELTVPRPLPPLPPEVEEHRDERWGRELTRQVQTPIEAERFVERVGFAACLTDARRPGPSLYVAVCGRRDAVMPRNVQTDQKRRSPGCSRTRCSGAATSTTRSSRAERRSSSRRA